MAQVILVMGVSGSGKTTVGQAVARQLGWVFADADDYHPQANRDKMARGEPLGDADRQPWLERLRQLIEENLAQGRSLVLACSALRERYRQVLMEGLPSVQLVYLRGEPALIAQRMKERSGHFMPPSLLESQLNTLEPPSEGLALEIDQSVEAMVAQVVAWLARAQ
jgi:gluconokinase